MASELVEKSALDFLLNFDLKNVPARVCERARLNILDLIGVGVAASGLPLSHIIRDHACEMFGGGVPMLFDTRKASAAGAALAGGMMIDALDGHDGYNIAKGHIGAALLPSVFALSAHRNFDEGARFLEAVILGYELGARLGPALHATAPDYHTSGAWMAVGVAGVGAHMFGLDGEKTQHALGIAEYHGPRSQMMRCIDHPTMLKDGAGWGAMAGVSAILLAERGFTGAPALTFGKPLEIWADLGERWATMEQYYKPYPVCRWSQPAIAAALSLRAKYALKPTDIERVEVKTFHEATRLAVCNPQNTEEAQYSLPFPVAVALARGKVGAGALMGEALRDSEILRLSNMIEIVEDEAANAVFPKKRIARLKIFCSKGEVFESDWHIPEWDPTTPPADEDLERKFFDFASALGKERMRAIYDAVFALGRREGALLRLQREVYRLVDGRV